MKFNTVIADDHTMFLDGLEGLLALHPKVEIIGKASNGLGVLELVTMKQVDLVISDLSMPVISGHALLKQLKTDHPTVKMIALTMHDEGKVIAPLIQSGLDGYILKDADKEELFAAIDTVMGGEKFFGNKVQQAVLDNLIPAREKQKNALKATDFTERELEIIRMIAAEHTQDEIAEKLFISANTVVYHKRKLMAMLEVKSAAGLVRMAAEMDLL